MHVSALVDDLVQLHNGRVPQVRQRVDLSVHGLLGLPILQIFLVVGLDCNHMLGRFVSSPANYSECTLSDLQMDLELFHLEGLPVTVRCAARVNKVSEGSQ